MNKKIYTCHGHWNTPDEDGVSIEKVSFKEQDCIDALKVISDTKAYQCLMNVDDYENKIIFESSSDTHYEIEGEGWYAKFYVTEEVTEE